MKTFKSELKELYLDWYNNYLTVGKFAEHHGTEERDMVYLLDLGKKYHELEINTFCDDNHENLFVGKLLRTDDELNDEIKKLEKGDIYTLSKTRYLMRES